MVSEYILVVFLLHHSRSKETLKKLQFEEDKVILSYLDHLTQKKKDSMNLSHSSYIVSKYPVSK